MQYLHIKDIDFKKSFESGVTRVFGTFMALDVEVRTQRDGVTKFISLNMCDKDIKIDAKKFGAKEDDINNMKNGAVYNAAIDIKEYAKAACGYSCTLYNFELSTEEPSEFIQWAEGMDQAHEKVQRALGTITESIYKDLVYNILVEHWNDFCVWTAASSLHHNMLGGLLVHTAEVIDNCEVIADYWENKYGPNFINKPLLLSGALLHDMAKTLELNVDVTSGNTEYSTQASLETHITMCASLIDIEAYKLQLGYQTFTLNEINEKEPVKNSEQLSFEKEAVSLLKHLILSHHGKKEWGSPIDMNCPEAYIVNVADEMSAEMYRYNKNFNTMESGTASSLWLSGNMVSTYKDSTK